MKRYIREEGGNTAIAILKAITNSSFMDWIGSASVSQVSVSGQAHSRVRAIL